MIPFEGATYGHELYRESKLMQAIQQMEKKNCRSAQTLISQAKQWPENLGVGKPYEENIDDRLEDWISYLCYTNQKDHVKAEAMLHDIIAFRPLTENTVSNFYMSNALVTAWAYEKLGGHDKALEWLAAQEKVYPGNRTLAWCRSVFEGKPVGTLNAPNKDANFLMLEEIVKNIK